MARSITAGRMRNCGWIRRSIAKRASPGFHISIRKSLFSPRLPHCCEQRTLFWILARDAVNGSKTTLLITDAGFRTFADGCAFVDGCDVDPVVSGNQTLDRAMVLEPGAGLPYEDDRFDLVVPRYVFEHLDDPDRAVSELLRVTRPGGWICAITPNKWGYLALASRMVPNTLHARVLRFVQPGRKEVDIFPTTYALNTPSSLKRYFGEKADVFWFRTSATPTYHFGRRPIYLLQAALHRLLPRQLHKGLCIFIRKREGART